MQITHNIGPFISRMQGAESTVKDELTAGVDRTTLQGERLAKQNIQANGSVVTGHMFRSTTATPAAWGGGQVTGKYGTNARSASGFNYPRAVEDGRGAVVARGRALAFRPKGSGQVIFRKRVGPAKAKPFIRPTRVPIRGVFRQEMRAAIGRIRAQLGGG